MVDELVGHVAILEVLRGNEVGVDDTGILIRAGLFPLLLVAKVRVRTQEELQLAETELNPFGCSHGFGDGCKWLWS